ncbi:MAG: YraN family protein [Proteobacteria bacterium]|nr:YraN family protein [Pseudomonadota bacterium]
MRDRKAAFLLGHDAEFWAALLLNLKGYRILARRFQGGGAEVDLVASRFGTLVFVEVKARATLEDALLTITPRKIERMSRAARAFLPRLPRPPHTIRCDAILVAPGHLPRHIVSVGELMID